MAVKPFRLIDLADRARDNGRFDEAAEIYRDAFLVNPDDSAAIVQCGHALKEVGRFYEAECAYRQGIVLRPEDPDIRLQLGHLLKISGERDAAVAAYREALSLEASSAGSDAERELRTMGEAADFKRNVKRSPIIVNISDLWRHARRGRAVTGIQRTQMEVAKALIKGAGHGTPFMFVCDGAGGTLSQVPTLELVSIWYRLESGAFARGLVQASPLELSFAGPMMPATIPSGSLYLQIGTHWDGARLRTANDSLVAGGIRVFTFIYDMIPILFPELCAEGLPERYGAWLGEVVGKGDSFVAISCSTMNDLRAFAEKKGQIANVQVAKLNVIADGLSQNRLTPYETEKMPKAPYVLCVGTIEPRKNHTVLLEAWEILSRTMQSSKLPALVIAGQDGWKNEQFWTKVNNSELQSVFVFIDSPSDALLGALYRNCLFTVYPSLYEGWGLPVTEALSFGKVVVAGRHSGVEEAGDGMCEFVDVRSPAEVAAAINRLVIDDMYRNAFEGRIQAKVRARSWFEWTEGLVEALSENLD